MRVWCNLSGALGRCTATPTPCPPPLAPARSANPTTLGARQFHSWVQDALEKKGMSKVSNFRNRGSGGARWEYQEEGGSSAGCRKHRRLPRAPGQASCC